MTHKDILLASRKIAVVRTDKLGDVVLTLPLCNAIKQIIPNAELTVIANSYTEPLLNKITIIDRLMFIDKHKNGIKLIFNNNKFDTIFFPRPRLEEAYAGFLNHSKLRIGSAYRLYSFFYNHKIWEHRKKGNKHEAEYNLGLLEDIINQKLNISFPKINLSNELIELTNRKIATYNIKSKYVIVHPGSGGSSVNWSPENFGKLSDLMIKKYNIDVLITGTKPESDLCYKVFMNSNLKAINLCGLLTLDEIIVLLKNAKLLVANSTGILHIASMFNIPIVGLYPNTSHLSKRRWGPYNEKSVVISPDSFDDENKDNMDLIDVNKVFSAIEKIIEF